VVVRVSVRSDVAAREAAGVVSEASANAKARPERTRLSRAYVDDWMLVPGTAD
jgi:hypothetical protein